jgi:hypothetical protein
VPHPLALLGGEHFRAGVPALGLQPVEHLVEDGAEPGHLGAAAVGRRPLPGLERVDPRHQLGQPGDGRGRAADQDEVDEHDHRDRHEQLDRLGAGRRHRGRSQGQDGRDHDDHDDVGQEDLPEQRQVREPAAGGGELRHRHDLGTGTAARNGVVPPGGEMGSCPHRRGPGAVRRSGRQMSGQTHLPHG